MARKTNAQLLVELEKVKADLAAAQAARAHAEAEAVEASTYYIDPEKHAAAVERARSSRPDEFRGVRDQPDEPDVFGGEDARGEPGGPSDDTLLDDPDAPPAWAQALLAQNAALAEEVEALKARKPKKAKTPVGQRDGDVTIRNITSRLVRVRLGKSSDPYRIELQPRGRQGDVADVPGSLVGTTQFKRNVGRVFEVITSDDAAGIDYSGTTTRQFPMAELVREAERIVARQKFDPNTGLPIEPMQQSDRSIGGPVGPRVAAAPGSDNVLMGIAEGTDPEFVEYLAWKASQGTLGAPMNAGPRPGAYEPGAQQGVSLLQRLEQAARSGDQEAATMARKLRASAEKGVIPEGELDKPIRLTHATVSVQPNNIY